MEKLMITASISGAEVTKAQNPAVPYTVEETVLEAKRAFDAGASIIHLHVREDDGTPTQSAERFKIVMEDIKKECPGVIIVPSTGGAITMTAEERMQPLTLNPEMATINCGTCNFGGNDIFVNTEETIIKFAQRMKENGIKPECECFDKGMIDMILRIAKKGYINMPMHFNFVMGLNGGITATARDFAFLRDSLPQHSTLTVTGIGKDQFKMVAIAIAEGVNVRVGLEDNLYLEKGVLAKNNGELVSKVVCIAKLLGREIASPAEARSILGLTK